MIYYVLFVFIMTKVFGNLGLTNCPGSFSMKKHCKITKIWLTHSFTLALEMMMQKMKIQMISKMFPMMTMKNVRK